MDREVCAVVQQQQSAKLLAIGWDLYTLIIE